nr:zinc finger bed domain-containing protein ricesleeper 1 [Quercus suber]
MDANEDANEGINLEINEDANEDINLKDNEDANEDIGLKVIKDANEGINPNVNEDANEDISLKVNKDANEGISLKVKEDSNEDINPKVNEHVDILKEDLNPAVKNLKRTYAAMNGFIEITLSNGLKKAQCVHCEEKFVVEPGDDGGTTQFKRHVQQCEGCEETTKKRLIMSYKTCRIKNDNVRILKNFNFDQEKVREAAAGMVIGNECLFKMFKSKVFNLFVNSFNPEFERISPRIAKEFEAKRKITYVRDALYELFNGYVVSQVSSNSGQGMHGDGPKGCSSSVCVDTEDDETPLSFSDSFELCMEQRTAGSDKSELDMYLEEGSCHRALGSCCSVLEWWKARSYGYPILSKMACDILSIPFGATSRSSLGTLHRLVDHYHASMSKEMVQALSCAADWLNCSNGIKSSPDVSIFFFDIKN